MDTLGISDQFQAMTQSIGIWEFLSDLTTCNAYKELTHNFLSRFHYNTQVISFQFYDCIHEMPLAAFNTLLGFPVDGETLFTDNDIHETWSKITNERTFNRTSFNSICHPLLRYIHQALSSSIFARAKMSTVTREEVFFIRRMLLLSGVRSGSKPNVGHFLATHIAWVIQNDSINGPIRLGGIIHCIARKIGVGVEANDISFGRQILNVGLLRKMQMIGRSRNPLFHLYNKEPTLFPLEPINFMEESTWKATNPRAMQQQPAAEQEEELGDNANKEEQPQQLHAAPELKRKRGNPQASGSQPQGIPHGGFMPQQPDDAGDEGYEDVGDEL